MSRTDATRAHVLATARALLEAGEDASMGRIAEAAGVSRQLLYLRFDGRGDLLLHVARLVDADARTPELQERIDRAPDARTALREAVAVQGEVKPAIESIVRVMQHLAEEDAEIAAAIDEREAARLDRVHEVVARLAAEGALADGWSEQTASELVWSVTSQHAWRQLVVDRGWTTEEWVTHTTTLLERALVD